LEKQDKDTQDLKGNRRFIITVILTLIGIIIALIGIIIALK
jgi:hypothetical protein